MQIKSDRIVFPDNTEQTTASGGGSGGDSFIAGMIMMWSGSIASIPSGWYLCDGTNNTPDLRNRFIIGANADDAGTAKTNVTGVATDTGGSKDAVVVSHGHTINITDNGHTHSTAGTGGSGGKSQSTTFTSGTFDFPDNAGGQYSTGVSKANITATAVDTGESGTDKNLPPYFALAFIMKGEII